MPDTTPNGKPATYAQSSLTGISNQTALNSGQQSVATTPLEPQPQPEQPQQRQKPAQLEGQMEKQLSNAIPLPSLVIQFAPKLTPIDVIKWPPEKTGRFHILVLVISIGAADKVVTKEQQRVISKCELTVCDQSATSFKLNLWSNSCEWVEKQMFRAGDALLITDVRVKGYRQQTTRGAVEKISGGTSWWSRMVKLDGSLLSLYRGHIEVESHLSVLAKKRRILALDLLDKEKGIANDGSFYITQPMCSLSTQPKFPVVSVGAGLLSSASSRDAGRPQRAAMGTHISGLMTLLSTGSKTANDLPANLPATPGALTTLKSILPTHITGTSIRACVVYRMLITAGDESQGWEVGAVMPNGRFVRIQSQHAASWIQDASPGRVLHFFGKFREKSDLFHIDGISREPYLLHDNAWAETIKNVQPRQFRSIRSMHEHKFMGDAILDAHIMAVSFPDLVDDNGEASYDSDMFGFIRCYCTGCYSIAVTSPQNPAILLCRECHSDPQKSRRPLEWMYPTFELSLADKPRLAANLASESLQVRCQLEVGDQVFMSVPARRWMQDEEGFWISRGRWRKLMELMNKQGECADEGRGTEDEVSAAAGGEGGGDDVAQRIRVEMRVGVNMVAKALRVAYL
ncbi:hypothetical protein EDD11_010414 [Mortierella claussenii]|nr:hypothetical protein EDD11_010414 [Mortierella claussenii]